MRWIPAGELVPPGLRQPPRNLVELLQARAEEKPGQELYRYLRGGEREEGPWTRAEIQRRARGVAVHLRREQGVAAGSRALLLFPAGLDFLSAFFGCLHAGVTAVPAPPPDPSRLARTLPRLQAIVRDARPDMALTDTATLEAIRKLAEQAPDLAALRWVAVDAGRFDSLAADWEEGWAADAGPGTLAYLQYTSGSTSSPKGVMVSHGNVLYQAECMRRACGYSPESHSVMWVPNFHDDGLVQGILEPLWAGGELILLSPLDVVQQPLRWLRAVTRYRGTHGGGPNFMYELCIRRVAPEQRAGLDLSSWQMAYNGAEPIREDTRARFLAAYAPHGFRASALWSAYGMAESTLMISSGGGPQGAPVFRADRAALETRNRVAAAGPQAAAAEMRQVVSCGPVVPGVEVVIVHPEKRVRCAPDEVGEIWAAGPTNAQGYWEKPEETEETFGARLVDDPEAGPFLRTGDLGFFADGELYVTGRYKDLIIVGGRNLYPQDVEQTAEKCHPALRPGGVAAFAVDTPDGEALVVVQELDPRRAAEVADLGEVLEGIRAAVTEAHEAPVEAVVLIPAGTLPKTSSGKVQRRPCKADFLAGTQETVAVWRRTAARQEPAPEAVPRGKTEAEIETWLVERLAAALNVDPREVEVDRPFARHKLDSRVALSLSGELEAWLGVRLSPTVFYEHPTVGGLVGVLATRQTEPRQGLNSSSPGFQPRAGVATANWAGDHSAGARTGDPAGDRTADPVGDRTADPVGDRTGDPVGDRTGDPAGDRTGDPAGDRKENPAPSPPGVETPGYWSSTPPGWGVNKPPAPDPIAILGWSCRFPGAPDRDAFRRLLWDGVDAVRELPEERRRLGFLQGLDPATLPSRGGFLEEVDGFDAPFFSISPREASTMDPQQRLLLEVSWEALESAGIAPTSLAGSPAGVFIGISTSDYAHLQVRFGDPSAVEPQMGTGTSNSIAANRISYFLGLRGPSLAVDTACSSSLVAVHLACRSLRSGESRMALAGGVNLILWPRDSVIFTRAGMLAPDGRCKTFDASADGYTRGEGCGVVVLKRLSDALADGDPVLAVIRGSAVNQDGFSSGLTAPNGEAQQEVLRTALADARLAPEDVGYVEAHGTGTALGDPIEVRALGAVLREKGGEGGRLRLGSVKTNLGHLEAAAGIAGLIKTVLILESGEIPPHLHLREVSPHISLDEAGAEIPTRVTPWPVDGGERRRAGVSSFGFGGTNAHVILEQGPAREGDVEVEEVGPRLFLLSARTSSALRALAARMAGFLRESPAGLADVCYTAAVGRAAFAHRLAAVVDSRQQLADRLAAFAESGEGAGVVQGKAEGRERPWVPPVEERARDRAVLSTLAALWVRGGEVDGRALYAGEGRRRVAMPTYPFERKGYWLELGDAPAPSVGEAAPARPGLKPRATEVSPLRGDAPAQILRSAQDDGVEAPVLDVLAVPAVLEGATEVTRLPSLTGFEGLLHLQMEALRDVAAMQIQFLAGAVAPSPAERGGVGEGVFEAAMEAPSPTLPRADARERAPSALPSTATPDSHAPFDLPLSEGQADLYTVAQVSPEAAMAYNETAVLDLRGPLDLKALRQALQSLVDRHESLRTVFPWGDTQRVLPALAVTLPLVDASGLPASRREAAVEVWLEGESRRAFDFIRGPLIRATVARIEPRLHRLLIAAHHLVADGFSIAGPLLRELLASYEALRGGTRPRLGPAFQYRHYMAWVAEEQQQAAIAAAGPYWLQRFADALPVFEPPADRPRPAVRSFRGDRIRRVWEPALRGAVQALGRRHGSTMFVTLFAAYAALLHRWTGQDDLVVGVPTAHRPAEDRGGDRLIGHCVDMVAIRSRAQESDEGGPEGPSFAQFLRATRRAVLDAQDHAAFPLSRLLRALNPPRDPSRAPIVNATFNLDQEGGLARAGGLELAWRSPAVRYVKSEVVLNAMEAGGALLVDVEHSTPLFDRATMERFHGHLRNLMEAAVASPDVPVAELPLLGEDERRQLLAWSRTAPAPRAEQGEATIHGLVAEQAAFRPEAVAVVDGEEVWTYAELNRRAARLARRLRAAGVGPEVPVAVFLERSAGLIEALLAVLQAGGAYVALDLGDPAERLAFLLEDSGARVVLTRKSLAARLPDTSPAVRLDLEEAEEAGLHEAGASITPDNAAYLVYTSGSTGRPKGVVAVHRGVVRLVQDPAFARFEPGDVWLPIAPVSFDASTLEIWGCLTNGGRLIVAPARQLLPEDISGLARRHGVTVLHLTTALFAPMVDSGLAGLGTVRQLLVGGDVMPPEAARRFLAARPDAELTNNYGPTENTTLTTSHRLRAPLPEDGRPVPIGRPLQGTDVYVVDRAFRPVPIGVAGELVTGGAGLVRGYHGRPDLTAERFVPHPFGASRGERLYRTGDLATFRADGTLSFLGRADHQVKVRGFRVEPAEVEAALLRHPGVKEAAVIARRGAESLVGFVVPRPGATLEGSELRSWLAGRLPSYLVPSGVVSLGELPLTPTGKVDRRALAARALDAAPTAPEAASGPRTPLEEGVAGIWGEVLGREGRERIGVHDSFFDLGGHSLLGTRLLSRLRNAFGLELQLSLLFEAPTVARLAARIEEALRDRAGLEALPPAPPIRPRPAAGPAPLSFAQQRLWFLDRFGPDSPVYNLPVAVRLAGALRVEVLAAALAEVVRRHEALRTTFADAEGGPVQRVSPPGPLALPLVDLSALPAAGRAAEAARLEREEGRRTFHLETGPLLRAALLRLAPAEHTLLLATHHIVADGWSFGVLLDELAALYSGAPPPPLPVRYGDYAAWQREWLQGEVLERLLAAARERLAGHPGALDLPADHPRPAAQSFRGRIEPVELPADLAAGAAALARQRGATLFMALLAAFDALLHRYTEAEDLLVGTSVAHRNRAEVEGLIGFFVNVLPVRTRLAGGLPFGELVDRVRDGALAAYGQQDLPFEKLVEALAPERDPSRHPLVQVFFALHNVMGAAGTARELAPGLIATADDLDNGVAKFDLALFFQERAGRLVGGLEHSTDLFERGTIRRFLGHFRTLLAGAVASPGTPLGELPLLSPEEEAELRAWSRSGPERVHEATIPELFAARASAAPDAPALLTADSTWTYGELDRASLRLAARLRSRGVGLDEVVGVFLERSPEMIVTLLAVLRAGGAYLPLDPEHPEARLRLLIEEAAPRLVVTRSALADRLPEGLAERLLVDAGEAEAVPADPLPRVLPDNLAQILYTSGSTGRPKGVAVVHRGVVRLIQDAAYARLDASQTWLQFVPVAFDVSILEIWGSLLNGGRLALAPPGASLAELAAAVERHGVTTLWLTTAVFQQAVEEHLPRLRSVRQLMAGGDVLPPATVRRLLEERPDLFFLNGYGPTENTTYTLTHTVASAAEVDGPIPLGRPIASTDVWVVDREQRLVPRGVPGELLTGGRGLSRGYHRRPDLTAERFIPHPFSDRPGERIYRSGDRVRLLDGGVVDILGRLDGQVKVRGFRVELGEVEACLVRHPAVREVAVARRRREKGDEGLAAFVVLREGAREEGFAAGLRAFAGETLPPYMVPSEVVVLPELILTASGKADRRAMLALEAPRETAGREPAAPRNTLEEILAGVWAEILRCGTVGIHDDFFDLGGHSLLATQVASRVRRLFGVEIPLAEFFQQPTVAALAARIGPERRRRGDLGGAGDAIPRVPRDRPLPLSFAQRRLWFFDRFADSDASAILYNVPLRLGLEGPLDTRALAGALAGLVQRHEALRTVCAEADGEPVQKILSLPSLESLSSLPLLDLAALPGPARAAEAARLDREDARRPFDLKTGPLLRTALLRLAEDRHRLLLSLHHIVSDGWSMGILVGELAALYRGESLAPLPVQYADFAAWQRGQLRGEALERQVGYWRERLEGAPPSLDLPADRPRPAVQSFRGADEPVAIPAAVSEPLARFGRSRGATLFMTLLAGFAVLLRRYGGQEDLTVGTPVANRNRPEVEGLIGFFVNTLAIRVDLGGDPPFGELVDRVRETALGAYAHQDLPFERLVEVLAPERDLARAPLFQVMFALQNRASSGVPELAPGLRAVLDGTATDTAKVDLSLSLEEGAQGLDGGVEYATDLFDRGTVRRLIRHFQALLDGAAADPQARLSDLPLLEAAERRQMLVDRNRTLTSAPRDGVLTRLFAAQVERAPEALAVDASLLTEGESLTYGELDRRARRLARRLRALGVGSDVPVALHLQRSPEMVVALLAVLQAGGAYVPLDPSDPEERLRFLVEDSGAVVRISRLGGGPAPGWLAADGVVVDLDRLEDGVADPALPEPGLHGDSLAYLIYTSGSTGRPKGVAVPHRAVPRLALDNLFLPLGPDDRIAHLSNTAFDAAVVEVWGALLNGAALVVVPRETALDAAELSAAIDRAGITFAFVTTALFHQIAGEIERGGGPRRGTLRLLTFGGEAVDPRRARAAWEHRPPGLALTAVYGPTETAVFQTHHPLGPECRDWPEGMAAVPIGSPIACSRAHVLDPIGGSLRPVPPGVAGELCLGGDGLARGYWRRPDLTAERFVPDPFAGEIGPEGMGSGPGGRLYRSGDRARYRTGGPDGAIEFLGRFDQQVKIRGFRVEPGEVEGALGLHPGVEEAVVLAVPGPRGERRLVAWIAGASLPTAELRGWLADRLPAYMVPSAFVTLGALPRTASGKVDRRALARRGVPAPEGEASEAARTPLEEVVAGVWCEVLERRRVGVRDSFFDLGGHSLLATRLLSQLREALGVELSLKGLFQEPTVAGLARQAEEARRRRQGIAAPPLARARRDQPVRLSFAQERLWLVEQLQPGGAAYNSAFANLLAGRLDVPALAAALAQIQRRHEVLRTRFAVAETAAGHGPEPVQVIAPPAALDGWRLPVADLEGLTEAVRRAEVRRLTDEEGRRPFDLARGPLVRAVLLRNGPELHGLLLTFHHAVCDGWSLQILTREIAALYGAFTAGQPSPLPELPVQYADYAAWQRDWLRGDVVERQLAFWRRQLLGPEPGGSAGEPPVLALPTDRPRPPAPSSAGCGRAVWIPPDLRDGLEALGRRHGASLFMTLLAAFHAFLHRHTGQERIHVGTPVAGRGRVELEPLIGFFVNTLVMPGDLAGDPPGGALLERVRDVTLDAFDHQDIPFEKLVAAFQRSRDAGRQPLFQAMFAFQSSQAGRARQAVLPGLTLAPLPSRAVAAQFDLTLSLGDSPGEEGNGLEGSLTGRADLFDPTTVRRFADRFARLLAGLVADPRCPVSELPLLTDAERHQVLAEWPEGKEARVADGAGKDRRPVPIGVYGVLWEDGRATGRRARYLADGTIQTLEGGDEGTAARPDAVDPAAVERRQARLDERRQQVLSRRSQLSPERRALLEKWVAAKPQDGPEERPKA